MEFEKSSIERLKRTLYSRNENVIPKEKRTPVSGQESSVPTDWGTDASIPPPTIVMSKPNNSFFNKFLVGSLVFFSLALLSAVFIFFGGLNMISSNNLDIKITAPSSVSSGEELLLGLSVVNGNRTDLQDVALFIEYPDGVESVGIDNKPLSRDKVNLGTIKSGSFSDYTVRALLFGEKDLVKTFKFHLEYKVKGSNAVFSKDKTYDVMISSSPVLLNVTYPKEVTSGQSLTLSIDIISNSSVVIKNSRVLVEYPYGFTYKSSNVSPLHNNSVWNMGDLKNGDKKTLTITGILVGQNLEDRSFRVSVGTKSFDPAQDMGPALATDVATIGIRKSFFDLGVTSEINGTLNVGQSVPITIKWQNTLPDKISNVRVVATLSGNAFDRSGVSVNDGGFYRSADSTISWDKNSTDNLADIFPGDSGQVIFSVVSFKNIIQSQSIKNPHIDIDVVMTGDRVGTDAGAVSSTENLTVKIPSILGFTAKSFRNVGPLNNSGPIPPRVDKESTYTITWTITNTTNDLKDTAVSASLPAGVEWKGESSPEGEKISYDSGSRTISWNVGSVAPSTGFTYSPRTVSFKVGLTPSINQVGSTLNLLSELNAVATDTYAEIQLSASVQAVTTQYSDATYKSSDGIVAK